MKNNTPNNANVQQIEPQTRKPKRKIAKKFKVIFIAFVITVSVAAIVGLSVALAFSVESNQNQQQYQYGMEAAYSRAYYDLLNATDDLEVKLKKLAVASNTQKQQSLLYEVWGTANQAEACFATFEGNTDGIMKAQRFVNQLGDFAHTLALKIGDGEELTVKDKATVDKLAGMLNVLRASLANVQSGLDGGKLFASADGMSSSFNSSFDGFVEPSVEYPEMIYDGPFSDALQNREVKGFKGEEIDKTVGQEKLVAIFGKNALSDIEFIGEGNGNIKTLNYTLNLDGECAFAQISKVGGRLVEFNMCSSAQSNEDNGIEPRLMYESAKGFATGAGFENMQVVWFVQSNGIGFVNLAPVQNDTIIYPDLVKVKVDTATGKVIGFDAMHYAFNHTDRKIPRPKLDESQARRKLSISAVGEGRLALIPLQETKEVLTYEFECEKDGQYYIYIDANTGREANILYVVSTDSGLKLQ